MAQESPEGRCKGRNILNSPLVWRAQPGVLNLVLVLLLQACICCSLVLKLSNLSSCRQKRGERLRGGSRDKRILTLWQDASDMPMLGTWVFELVNRSGQKSQGTQGKAGATFSMLTSFQFDPGLQDRKK